jgi:tetratricopeptide (TPR) repeat protein
MGEVIKSKKVFGRTVSSATREKMKPPVGLTLKDFVSASDLPNIEADVSVQVPEVPNSDFAHDALKLIHGANDAGDADHTAALVEGVMNYPEDPQWHFDHFMEKGEALFSTRRYDAARTYFLRACALRPDDVRALTRCAAEFARAEKYDTAANLLRDAHAIAPTDNEVKYQLGLCIMKQLSPARSRGRVQTAKIDEAITVFNKLIGDIPDYAEVHKMLGELHGRKGQNGQALFHLQQAASHARNSGNEALRDEVEIMAKKYEPKIEETAILAL